MYINYSRIGKKGISVALSIIMLLFSALFFILIFYVDKTFTICFILFSLFALFESISYFVLALKAFKFGDKNIFKEDIKRINDEKKKIFRIYNLLITILSVIGGLSLIIGIIILIAI